MLRTGLMNERKAKVVILVAFLTLSFASPVASQEDQQGGRELLSRRRSRYANRILLGSHNRVLWLDLRTGQTRVLTEGRGVYHGIIAGDADPAKGKPRAVWVLSRPHNWRATSSVEALLKLSALTGFQLGKVEIPTRFAHDVQRIGDKVFVVSTGDGSILELDFPSMQLSHHLRNVFSIREHINTIAASGDGHLWVMKHNLGESDIVKIDRSGKVLAEFPKVGRKAHGLVPWKEYLVILDSQGGALNLVHNTTGAVSQIFKMTDKKVFLKGLVVLENRAIFGVNQHAPRSARNDPRMDAEVAVVDLLSRLLLSRIKVPTRGLLNVIASPEQWRSLPPGLRKVADGDSG